MLRIWALIERELRRFRRNLPLVVVTALGPLLQLVIMGYAFGGTLHDLKLGVVDQDHGVPAIELREMTNAVAANARTFQPISYADEGRALSDLRAGKLNGVLTIPPGFSRRTLAKLNPEVALIQNNTDKFAAAALSGSLTELVSAFGKNKISTRRLESSARLDVVELFPYIPYIQYLLPGTIVLAIYTMVMIGGAFSFIDDKTRGLHEGYLVTPITKLELVAGFNISGAIKAVTAGLILTIVGSLMAGVPQVLEPVRLLKAIFVVVLTSLALVSLMFMLMVRVNDIMIPRILGMLLNTLLYFPSGAVYPTQAFPGWMRAMSTVNPFTYAVHALRGILIQDVQLSALVVDLAALGGFTAVAMVAAAAMFRRSA
jgi:ABC-2 type transport system permease protein